MQSLRKHVIDRLHGSGKDSIPEPSSLQRRQIHIEPGLREKALLEEDPALKKFKSYKKGIWRLQRAGDVISIIVVAGCCYEIYHRTMKKKAEREQQNTGE
ncbi:hypothetical protein SUGI_1057250 [Cryptomeria japonica]|uniref:succinate dehydrogenase subunit 7A, mitochondrial n=1 Tax=Cryptomeria japonica TaxID=3369 RepID=UPI0024149987|nr:succinate dehydrogenase subunit 7A, mitochondrial [Cryptomeria japonica]GLJ49786.1 hypothetical protein SUGI_1057250 [Cryptomeria japonica]